MNKLNGVKSNLSNLSLEKSLEETFIRNNYNRFNWVLLSKYQKLSNDFLSEFINFVDIESICTYQKLSIDFIEKHKEILNWYCLCRFQALSEDFIEEYKYLCIPSVILLYQRLSTNFLNKYLIDLSNNSISISNRTLYPFNFLNYKHMDIFNLLLHGSWMYKDSEYKRNEILKTGLYEIIDDYVYAYKAVRADNFSVLNYLYQYDAGKIYEAHADYNPINVDSFGLSAWTFEGANDYYSSGKILKIKVHLDDVACLVHEGNKLRCTKIKIVEEV